MLILSKLYSFLFALSLTLINPWGETRGEVWTSPKVLVVFSITLINCLVALQAYIRNHSLFISNIWKIGLGLWTIFLGAGLISTVCSSFPLRSLWGNSALGDGWIYWVLISIFVLSNSLVLLNYPTLFRLQVYGVLIGGLIASISIIPQLFDWRIDYTITSGQVTSLNSQRLLSSIWKTHMPIGLYSNRGHTAFVTATTAIISILAASWRLISPFVFVSIFSVLIFTLIFTQTRAGILAFSVSASYLALLHFYQELKKVNIFLLINSAFRRRAKLILIFFIAFTSLTTLLGFIRHSESSFFFLSHLETVSRGRLHLLSLGLKGITERPILGWGFDGFGIAFPHLGDWTGAHKAYLIDNTPVSKVLNLGDFIFSYKGTDGHLHLGILITNKAHNLIIDNTLSVGIVGLIASFTLLGFFIWNASKSSLFGIESLSIVYIIYTFFWFESAQYSHLFWWGLCFWNKSLDTRYLEKFMISDLTK